MIGYYQVTGLLWIFIWWTKCSSVVSDGAKCRDIFISSSRYESSNEDSLVTKNSIYLPPFKGKICISKYPETWDTAYRVCQYNSSTLLNLNVFNLNYSDIRPIIGDTEVVHIGIRRQYRIFNWIGLKPQMFDTSINQSEWGWHWDHDEPKGEDCVAVNVKTGKLLTVSCDNVLKKFICARKDGLDMNSKLCKSPWKYSSFSKVCVRETSSPLSESNAGNLCASLSGHLMSRDTYLASFPGLRFEYTRLLTDSRVWLNKPDIRNNTCYYGELDSDKINVDNALCPLMLRVVCEQDSLPVDIKAVLVQKSLPNTNFEQTTLLCETFINGIKEKHMPHFVWWRNGEVLSVNEYSLIFGYVSGTEQMGIAQGRYWCEVMVPGYPDFISSTSDEFYDKNVSTILLTFESNDIPYDPTKYDRSKPDFQGRFLQFVEKQFSVVITNFKKELPYLPVPEWQLINASKTGSATTLKINIFLNYHGKERSSNEEQDIFNPMVHFLSHQCRSGIGEWRLQKYNITHIGMCFTESSGTMLGDITWNQTYHSKQVVSSPMCLSSDWRILTRSCDGGYGSGSKWHSFNSEQCERFNKVLENADDLYCQPGYKRWNYKTCIKIYSKPENWSEAVTECGRSLGFLFTPNLSSGNELDLRNFNSTFKRFEKLGEIWLGGHRENGLFQWMAFKPGPIELDKSSVVEWEEKYNVKANCVSGIIRNGKILTESKPCEEKMPYVCMHKNPEGLYPTSECRKNWYGSPWSNFCYMINNNSYTWEKALNHCENYTPDGTLAVLLTPEENELLKDHLLNQFKEKNNLTWWIGLERIKDYFLWLNSNRSEVTYVDWFLDADHNLSESVVALRKKENNIKWLQLNPTTEIPSICQTRTVTGETWCKVSVRKSEITKRDIYRCDVGHAVYGSITWYKDGVAVSGNRGLIQGGINEFNPVDLLNNSVLPLKEFQHLQGYYWCEVLQKSPFLSVASPNILYVNTSYWTFLGYFIATEIEGHYDIGQKTFWNMSEEIGNALKKLFGGYSLVRDIYVADIIIADKGNKVKFYIYSTPVKGKKQQSIISKKKQYIERIKQYTLLQLRESESSFVERYGIVLESVSVMSTEYCFAEETIIGDEVLYWRTTLAGRSASPADNCINEDGYPVVRSCLGNFTHGVHWGPVTESCSGKGSNLTLSLKTLSEKILQHSNVKSTSETLEILTRNTDELVGMDIHYIATTLENIAEQKMYSGMAFEDITATVSNVMSVQQEIIDDVQKRMNSSLRIVASFETVLKDSKTMHSIIKPKIAVMSFPLNRNNSPNVVGFVAKDTDEDSFQLGDLGPITEGITGTKFFAGIWLPPDVLRERTEANSFINFVLYRNSTLFVAPYIRKKAAIVSPVISAFLTGEPLHLFTPRVQLTFTTWQVENSVADSARCVYWEQSMNRNQGGWSSIGCTKPNLHLGNFLCYCDHMTSFAVLVDLYDADGDDNIQDSAHGVALDIITYVGCTLSIFGLLLTIITFAMFRKLRNGLGSQVLCNLSVSLLLSLIVFMVGINQTHWKPGCMIVAALLHYLLMVAFSWMLVEAILQYLRLVKVIGTYIPRFMLKSALCAWGIPLLVVVSILAIDYELYHSKRNYCWIHIKAFYYGFLLPLALIMVCNIVIFALIIHSITCGRQKGLRTNQNERKLAITRLRAACCILFLLGLSWSFGFLAISDARLIFKYLFSIFTTLQGFFIFLFHVVQEKTTRNLWYSYFFQKESQVQTFTTRDTSTLVKDSVVSRNK